LFSHDRSPSKKIAYCGVPSIGFDLDMSSTKLPNLIVYQINTSLCANVSETPTP
jgi:hypothetical protein